MGWDISLKNEFGEPVKVERFQEGSIIDIEGHELAEITVTYNYGKFFDFKSLNGKKAIDTIPELDCKLTELGTEIDNNYWKPTSGNVGHTINILLKWAINNNDCVWEIT